MFNTKEQNISQEETRQNIINDMVKKRSSIVPESSLTSMMVPGYCGLSLLPQFPFGVPLVLLWLSYRALMWIRSVFLDEPSGRSTSGRLQGKKVEREEGLMVIRRNSPLTDISSNRIIKYALFVLMLMPLLVSSKPVTQEGVAYLYDYKAKTKKPLAGVSFTVADAEPTKSISNGSFTLCFMTQKKGSKITNIRQPFFKGLKVFNKKDVDDWYIVDGKLELIMCDYEEFELVKKTYYEQGKKDTEKKYIKRQKELEQALNTKQLRESEYEQQLQELRESYQHTLDNLNNSADAMARIDQSELSHQMQEVLYLYEQGEVDKAMEMLSGMKLAESLEQSIKQKEQSKKAYHQALKDSLMAVKNIRSAIQLFENNGEWEKVERYRWILANHVGTPLELFEYAHFCDNRIEYRDSIEPYYLRVMKATEHSRKHTSNHQYLYATAAYNLGCYYQSAKQQELANKYLTIGLEERKFYAQSSHNPNDEGHVAWALVGMGSGEIANGKYAEAFNHFREAEDIYDRIVALNPDEHYWAYGRLCAHYGDLYRKQNCFERADSFYVKAMTIFCEYINLMPVEYLIYVKYTYNSLLAWMPSMIYTQSKLGKYDEIQKTINLIFPYYLKIPLKDAGFRENASKTMGSISDQLIKQKLFNAAEEIATQAISIDSNQKWIHMNLAAALLFQGRYSEAETVYRQFKSEYKKDMLEDLETFATNGVVPKERETDVERIKILLTEE